MVEGVFPAADLTENERRKVAQAHNEGRSLPYRQIVQLVCKSCKSTRGNVAYWRERVAECTERACPLWGRRPGMVLTRRREESRNE